MVQEGLSLSTPSSFQDTCSIEGLVNMIVFNMNDYIPKKKKCDEGETLVKWLLEFLGIPRKILGIPRNKGVNFHGKFGLGIPRNSQP